MFGSSRPTGLQRSTRNVDGSSDFWLEVAKLTFTIGFGVYSAHLVRKMISVHTDAVQGTAEQAEADVAIMRRIQRHLLFSHRLEKRFYV